MALLIETSLWVDYLRLRAPRAVKQFVAPYILDANACVAEPIIFEMFRFAAPTEIPFLKQNLDLMPMLRTPEDIWGKATELGQKCRRNNFTAGPMDLVIATVALEHSAEVVTFDDDFARIAKVCNLRVRLLVKPK